MAEKIRKLGDPVLRRKARPVKKIGRQIRELLDRMARTMYAATGVGLAAPQIGVSRRVIVLDVGQGLLELVNPEVEWTAGEVIGVEGCLSLPGMIGEVPRAESVRVSGLNRQGNRIWVEGSGLLARALQHEIDHLDGILLIDRAIKVMTDVEAEEKRGGAPGGGERPVEGGSGQ